MKKRLFNSSFEVLFTAGIVVALALPQLLFAQKHKEVNISIHNNDTTFNGKNLKDMKPAEKQEALTEINKTVKPKGPRLQNLQLSFADLDSSGVRVYTYKRDSVNKGRLPLNLDQFRGDNINGMGNLPDMEFRIADGTHDRQLGALRFNNSPLHIRRMGNTQNFDYNNTDKDGISTHVSYHVTEAFTEAAKKVSGVEKSDLDLQDLTLTPQFSAGKTTLAFTLPAKTAADVQLTDSDGKIIWKEKATTAAFNKSFTWGLNGVFYLVVKQGGKTAVKRIVKE
ncbi:T9SS type A sorting domain-containing protein [Mucilaginibacter galii]|uniref:T9SS type A sorting domain-containing protein n=1 Tax=Mucilaginibacter galii TaxID=2005073 RepID=A0A917N395_9SPHI|nr:T9SS type A sorting domain-containing protein [Mucilaginibacter galii]GGI52294.1 hypothetical protein GCM10011425_35060 [Mucilaginibacter galii]